MQANKNELTFDSGRVTVHTGSIEVLQVGFRGKTIDIDLKDELFMRKLIRMRIEISEIFEESRSDGGEKKKPKSPRFMLKKIADILSKNNITVTLSYRGETLVTIGAQAHSTLLQLITKTRAVAINNFSKTMRLARYTLPQLIKSRSDSEPQEEGVERVDVQMNLEWQISPD